MIFYFLKVSGIKTLSFCIVLYCKWIPFTHTHKNTVTFVTFFCSWCCRCVVSYTIYIYRFHMGFFSRVRFATVFVDVLYSTASHYQRKLFVFPTFFLFHKNFSDFFSTGFKDILHVLVNVRTLELEFEFYLKSLSRNYLHVGCGSVCSVCCCHTRTFSEFHLHDFLWNFIIYKR